MAGDAESQAHEKILIEIKALGQNLFSDIQLQSLNTN